jgi:3-oxoacyl-[acyl-carrier-protein] synthase-3
MAFLSSKNVAIKGICCSLPDARVDNRNYPFKDQKEADQFIQTTGIRYRYIAPPSVALSDLALHACEKLIHGLAWEKNSIEFLILVSQTPDFPIPGTGPMLQDLLGLSTSTFAMDINLGCSGYVYGLSTIMALMQQKPNSRGLLVVGDLSSRCFNISDRSTAPLFSDAVSATALEFESGATASFELLSDGKGYQAIQIPAGGSRNPITPHALEEQEIERGIRRRPIDMILNGTDIFHFALKEVAPNISSLLSENDQKPDFIILHQANKLINDTIAKKLNLPAEKFPQSLLDFGNASSASIPLTAAACLSEKLSSENVNLVLAGFGVGLSWASAQLETKSIYCPSPFFLAPD